MPASLLNLFQPAVNIKDYFGLAKHLSLYLSAIHTLICKYSCRAIRLRSLVCPHHAFSCVQYSCQLTISFLYALSLFHVPHRMTLY